MSPQEKPTFYEKMPFYVVVLCFVNFYHKVYNIQTPFLYLSLYKISNPSGTFPSKSHKQNKEGSRPRRNPPPLTLYLKQNKTELISPPPHPLPLLLPCLMNQLTFITATMTNIKLTISTAITDTTQVHIRASRTAYKDRLTITRQQGTLVFLPLLPMCFLQWMETLCQYLMPERWEAPQVKVLTIIRQLRTPPFPRPPRRPELKKIRARTRARFKQKMEKMEVKPPQNSESLNLNLNAMIF